MAWGFGRRKLDKDDLAIGDNDYNPTEVEVKEAFEKREKDPNRKFRDFTDLTRRNLDMQDTVIREGLYDKYGCMPESVAKSRLKGEELYDWETAQQIKEQANYNALVLECREKKFRKALANERRTEVRDLYICKRRAQIPEVYDRFKDMSYDNAEKLGAFNLKLWDAVQEIKREKDIFEKGKDPVLQKKYRGMSPEKAGELKEEERYDWKCVSDYNKKTYSYIYDRVKQRRIEEAQKYPDRYSRDTEEYKNAMKASKKEDEKAIKEANAEKKKGVNNASQEVKTEKQRYTPQQNEEKRGAQNKAEEYVVSAAGSRADRTVIKEAIENSRKGFTFYDVHLDARKNLEAMQNPYKKEDNNAPLKGNKPIPKIIPETIYNAEGMKFAPGVSESALKAQEEAEKKYEARNGNQNLQLNAGGKVGDNTKNLTSKIDSFQNNINMGVGASKNNGPTLNV